MSYFTDKIQSAVLLRSLLKARKGFKNQNSGRTLKQDKIWYINKSLFFFFLIQLISVSLAVYMISIIVVTYKFY